MELCSRSMPRDKKQWTNVYVQSHIPCYSQRCCFSILRFLVLFKNYPQINNDYIKIHGAGGEGMMEKTNIHILIVVELR